MFLSTLKDSISPRAGRLIIPHPRSQARAEGQEGNAQLDADHSQRVGNPDLASVDIPVGLPDGAGGVVLGSNAAGRASNLLASYILAMRTLLGILTYTIVCTLMLPLQCASKWDHSYILLQPRVSTSCHSYAEPA